MKIQLTSADPGLIRQIAEDMPSVLNVAGLEGQFSVAAPICRGGEARRGDPVTLATIVLAAISAGGAVTVGMGKEGFLTRLAKVLEAWVNRKVEVTVETEDGRKIHLSGSASHIERMLKEQLKP